MVRVFRGPKGSCQITEDRWTEPTLPAPAAPGVLVSVISVHRRLKKAVGSSQLSGPGSQIAVGKMDSCVRRNDRVRISVHRRSSAVSPGVLNLCATKVLRCERKNLEIFQFLYGQTDMFPVEWGVIFDG